IPRDRPEQRRTREQGDHPDHGELEHQEKCDESDEQRRSSIEHVHRFGRRDPDDDERGEVNDGVRGNVRRESTATEAAPKQIEQRGTENRGGKERSPGNGVDHEEPEGDAGRAYDSGNGAFTRGAMTLHRRPPGCESFPCTKAIVSRALRLQAGSGLRRTRVTRQSTGIPYRPHHPYCAIQSDSRVLPPPMKTSETSPHET